MGRLFSCWSCWLVVVSTSLIALIPNFNFFSPNIAKLLKNAFFQLLYSATVKNVFAGSQFNVPFLTWVEIRFHGKEIIPKIQFTFLYFSSRLKLQSYLCSEKRKKMNCTMPKVSTTVISMIWTSILNTGTLTLNIDQFTDNNTF